MNLKTRDYGLIGGGVLATLLGAGAAEAGMLSGSMITRLTSLLPKLTILIILAGLGFVYLSRDLLGGDVSDNLDVIGAGFLIYAVIWWPHKIGYHGPLWGGKGAGFAGITSTTWNVFFHTLTGVLFAIAAFGFYRFWQISKEVDT